MPYVSMHTTGDPIVTFEQQELYELKAMSAGASAELSALTVSRFGHCNFAPGDLTAALTLLLQKIEGTPFTSLTAAVPIPYLR
jgi:hypothetical protein